MKLKVIWWKNELKQNWGPNFLSAKRLYSLFIFVLVDAGVTPALRRRRERAERQRSFIREQQEASASMRPSTELPDNQESEYLFWDSMVSYFIAVFLISYHLSTMRGNSIRNTHLESWALYASKSCAI